MEERNEAHANDTRRDDGYPFEVGFKGHLVIAVVVAGTALRCGGSRGEDVFGPADAGSSSGSAGSSGSSGSTGSSDGSSSPDGSSSGARDASGGSSGDAGESCQRGGSCGPGRTCLCCGSAGPSEICLCTNACKNDVECPYSTHSLCNKPRSQQEGICTPRDFNCCWACQ